MTNKKRKKPFSTLADNLKFIRRRKLSPEQIERANNIIGGQKDHLGMCKYCKPRYPSVNNNDIRELHNSGK